MITKFSEYIKESAQDKKILFIVDVQKEFDEFIPKGMVEALMEYCKEFDEVYQIWDSNKAKQPSYKFPNEVQAIIKKFGTKFSEDLEDTVEKLNKKYPNAKTGDMFEFDDVDSYVVKVLNNHGYFYVPETLSKVFKSLKGYKVTLVGGAKSECIMDVYTAMKAFGMLPQYNQNYIFSAQTSNTQEFKK